MGEEKEGREREEESGMALTYSGQKENIQPQNSGCHHTQEKLAARFPEFEHN